MSGDCCTDPVTALDPGKCPKSGSRGQTVEWRTVAALTHVAVPPRQTFWLCRDADCDVVYFGDAGTCFGLSDLRVEPGFKTSSREGLVCYCFLYRYADIETALRQVAESTVLDRIKQEVEARNCACEVRNPSGRCCIGEVKKITDQIALIGREGVKPFIQAEISPALNQVVSWTQEESGTA